MAKLAASVYGDALFELAAASDRLDQFQDEIRSVDLALKNNQELLALMHHPKIAKEEKISLIERIFKGRVMDEITGFLVLLISKGRYDEIFSIFDYFISRTKEYKRIGAAEVITAVKINEHQRGKIRSKLLSTTNYVDIEIEYKVDPGLIGGIRIRIGDRVIDSSIRSKLEDLRAQLKKLQLA